MNHPIKPRLAVIDGNATATSLTLAEHFGMRHDNVLQAIDNTIRDNPEDFGRFNFQAAEYLDAQHKPRPMYRLTKDALCFVVLGLTGSEAGHWKAAYIETFDAMAGTLRRHDGDTERRLREVVEFGKQFCLSSQRAEEALLMLLSEALQNTGSTRTVSQRVTGMHGHVAQAMDLLGALSPQVRH